MDANFVQCNLSFKQVEFTLSITTDGLMHKALHIKIKPEKATYCSFFKPNC